MTTVNKGELIQKKFQDLLQCSTSPLSDEDVHNITRAFNFAMELHKDDELPKGTPFILHNLNVAITAMKEIGLGPTSAICALLHGDQTKPVHLVKKIRADFGDQVAEIIEGFNKISELRTDRISFQSEAFRTLFLSMVNDMRVILIKLAHRLNDMRHIDIRGDKAPIFIDEVKHIYTPIAHRLGLYNVKTELEERVMKYQNIDLYNSISQKVKETKTKREVFIKEFIRPIEREMMVQSIDYEIRWRTKSVPSIYNKMRRQNVDFEEVYDLFAIRIIIDSKPNNEKELCWKVYSIVTNIYQPNPKRLRDWISSPKASGYESLHTTVLGMNNKWVEVQIRTRRMDDGAEKGQAAHWQYKGVMNKRDTEDWLSQVRDILENPDQIIHDFAYKSNGNGKSERIFVFTPKGDLKQLKAGATVLDFAYEVHTDVGATCQGARVNNRVVPIRYVLKNGDKVDIITGKNQKPKLDWLAFVKTERARTRIKRQLKEEKYREAEIGKDILNRKLKNWKIKSSEDLINFLVKSYKLDTGTDLYYLIAEEKIDISDIKKRLLEFVDADPAKRKDIAVKEETKPESKAATEELQETVYIGENLKNVNYRLAKCCNPIQGDNVFGFVTTTGGITIHRKSCPNAKSLLSRYPYRVMAIKWVKGGEDSFSTTNLRITGTDELGLVSAITTTISDDLRVNMRSINFQKKGRHFEGRVTVMVKDHEHLDQLIAKLMMVKGVERVVRAK